MRTSARSPRLALAVLCAAFFVGVLDSTSVFAALPSIGDDLGVEGTRLAWVVTVYGVVVAGFMLPFGRMADVAGRRRVFLGAVAVFGAGSLACGLATSGEFLIAARAVQALGAAALTPSALALLLSIFPEGPGRNRALGIWGGLGGVGATAGLLLGGLLTDGLGWAWVFFINLPVVAIVLVVTPRVVPESRQLERRPFDLPGGVLLSVVLMLLVFGLLGPAADGWGAFSWVPFAGAAVLAVALAVVERRSVDPILPARLFRSRPLVVGNVVVVISGLAVDGLLALSTVYAQQLLGASSTLFGLVLAAMTVTSVVAVGLGQRLVTRYGVRPVAAGGLVLLAVACASFVLLPADPVGLALMVGGLIVFGAGMGATFVAGQIGAVMGVDPDDAGAASGLEETSFTVGSTIGVALVSAIMIGVAGALAGEHARPDTQLVGLHAGFATLAVACVAGVIVALAFPRRGRVLAVD